MRLVEVLGISDKIGTIEIGKVADLIAVTGDILLDLECLNEVALVIKDGIVIRNEIEV